MNGADFVLLLLHFSYLFSLFVRLDTVLVDWLVIGNKQDKTRRHAFVVACLFDSFLRLLLVTEKERRDE